MMRLSAAGLVLLLCACRAAPLAPETYTYPAEWEPQEAIWLVWRGTEPMDSLTVTMIRALAPHVAVQVIVARENLVETARSRLRSEGVGLAALDFLVLESSDFYIRDFGPLFLRGSRGGMKVADFGWNAYGEDPDGLTPRNRAHGRIDRDLADRLGLATVPSDLVVEGGAIEVNGAGTLLLVEAVDLQRNPDWTREQIEAEYRRVLGQEKVIWLEQGLAEDPHNMTEVLEGQFALGTGGHIDEVARFADADTILLAWIAEDDPDRGPLRTETRRRMEANHRRLVEATDQAGRPFEIVRVPLPESRPRPFVVGKQGFGYEPGDELLFLPTMSYLNYVISNGVVLLPSFAGYVGTASQKRMDEETGALFTRLFPDREIVRIEPLALNLEGAGPHCAVQQQPARNPVDTD